MRLTNPCLGFRKKRGLQRKCEIHVDLKKQNSAIRNKFTHGVHPRKRPRVLCMASYQLKCTVLKRRYRVGQ